MYKVAYYIKFWTILVILVVLFLLPSLLHSVSDNFLFFPVAVIAAYFAARAIKYMYLMKKSDFTSVTNIEKGVLLQNKNSEKSVDYKDIELISIQQIGIFGGLFIDRVGIKTKDSSLQGFITKGYNFQNTIPATIKVERLENNYYKW